MSGRPGSRLITVLGAGGSGKTRLASRLVDELRRRSSSGASAFPGGIFWADLAPFSAPAQLAWVLARAVGLEGPFSDPSAAVRDAFRDGRVLVVLDNCDELAPACEELVTELLGACSGLVLMATSRVPLRVAGCAELTVQSLRCGRGPETSAHGRSEAAELFCDRMSMVAPGYVPSAADSAAVEELCRFLDGVPLAIELAAPWIRVLAPRDLLSRTAAGLDMLTATSAATGRHHSMRAVLDSSWPVHQRRPDLLLRGRDGAVHRLPRSQPQRPLRPSRSQRGVHHDVPHLGELRLRRRLDQGPVRPSDHRRQRCVHRRPGSDRHRGPAANRPGAEPLPRRDRPERRRREADSTLVEEPADPRLDSVRCT